MQKVVEFLQKNSVQYLATVGRDGKAKCRPFMFCFEQEDVYKRQVLGRGTDTVRPWCEIIKITDQ